LRFEAALGASAQFWLNAQTAWDLWQQLHSPKAMGAGVMENEEPGQLTR